MLRNSFTSGVSFARTEDTNAYTAGDVIGSSTAAGGAVLKFPGIGRAGDGIIITDVSLRIDVAAVPSGMTSFRMQLYNATPPSALADNAAWDLPSGDRASYLGYIDMGSPVDVGSTLFVQQSGLQWHRKLGLTNALWGYLVPAAGFTPASATVKAIVMSGLYP